MAGAECADTLAGSQRERRAGAEGQDAVELPVADHIGQRTAVGEVFLALAEREIVEEAGDRAMPDIPSGA